MTHSVGKFKRNRPAEGLLPRGVKEQIYDRELGKFTLRLFWEARTRKWRGLVLWPRVSGIPLSEENLEEASAEMEKKFLQLLRSASKEL